MTADHRVPRRLLACLLAVTAVGCAVQAPDQPSRPPRSGAPPRFACGVDRVAADAGDFVSMMVPVPLAAKAAQPDGTAVYFEQDPPILSAQHRGPVTFRNFTVVGDVRKIHIARVLPGSNGVVDESRFDSFSQTGTRTVGGVQVSLFEPTWTADQFHETLREAQTGFDSPTIYWGRFIDRDPQTECCDILLRFASTQLLSTVGGSPTLPDARWRDLPRNAGRSVGRYTADIVNLVVEGFGDRRIWAGDQDLALAEVAGRFYDHFEDVYHVLSIVPQAVHLAHWGGFHTAVKNEIRGLNISGGSPPSELFDETSSYGSAGTLEGVHFYPQGEGVTFDAVGHEFAHQYAHYFDWQELAGVTRSEVAAEWHAPLWHPGEAQLSQKLAGGHRLDPTSGGGWVVAEAPAPFRFHPLTLYGMGLIAPRAVPAMRVLTDQQEGTLGYLEVGTRVTSGTEVVDLPKITRRYGARTGPRVAEKLRWATVIVSRDDPLTQAELNYWTYLARRLGDPAFQGLATLAGYGNIETAAGGRIDMLTEIRPKVQRPIRQDLAVADPPFATLDWQGLRLEEPIQSSLRPGRRNAPPRVRLRGQITDTSRADWSELTLYLARSDATSWDHAFSLGLRRRRSQLRFDQEVVLRGLTPGRYLLAMELQHPQGGRWLGPTWQTLYLEP